MMKKVLIVMGAVLLFAFALAAQNQAPTIVFDSQSNDFGKLIEGQPAKHVFKFTNKGNATLEIIKVESS